MKNHNDRQQEIRDIVRTMDVRTQRELVDILNARGYKCTQATVSRDINEIGLRKLPEGVYVLAEDLRMQRMVTDLVSGIDRSGNLVVIKSAPGSANTVAAALDDAALPDVMGSIAGDDTIMVIGRSVEGAEAFERTINKLLSLK